MKYSGLFFKATLSSRVANSKNQSQEQSEDRNLRTIHRKYLSYRRRRRNEVK